MLITSEIVDLDTPTGVMRTYVHRPKHDGKVPAVLFYSEIFQQTGPITKPTPQLSFSWRLSYKPWDCGAKPNWSSRAVAVS